VLYIVHFISIINFNMKKIVFKVSYILNLFIFQQWKNLWNELKKYLCSCLICQFLGNSFLNSFDIFYVQMFVFYWYSPWSVFYFQPDHLENCHLNAKKLPKIVIFSTKLLMAILLKKNDNYGNFFEKMSSFLAIFWHSNGNFPEGQLSTNSCETDCGMHCVMEGRGSGESDRHYQIILHLSSFND